MGAALRWLIYLSGMVFILGSAARAVAYARMPESLRWELYPLPKTLAGQMAFTLAEVLLLRGVWLHNRRLWFRSYPFHLGIYSCAASVAALLLGVEAVASAAAFAGLGLLVAGSAALLVMRLTDPALRDYTAPADLFNLSFFLVSSGLLLGGILMDASSPAATARAIAAGRTVHPLTGLGAALCALLAAYIPFTHMAHFVAKYFAFHKVRWDEHSARRVGLQLRFTPTWSARHMGTGGGRTWLDVATTNPPVEKKK
jgi:nitrate reductase gamma subunit